MVFCLVNGKRVFDPGAFAEKRGIVETPWGSALRTHRYSAGIQDGGCTLCILAQAAFNSFLLLGGTKSATRSQYLILLFTVHKIAIVMAGNPKLDVMQVEELDTNDPKVLFVPPNIIGQMSADVRKRLERKLLRKLDLRLMCTVGETKCLSGFDPSSTDQML